MGGSSGSALVRFAPRVGEEEEARGWALGRGEVGHAGRGKGLWDGWAKGEVAGPRR